MKSFNITLPGNYHILHLKNCQDHAFIDHSNELTIGVVSDGVGSLDYSEFTSFLTASWTIEEVKRRIARIETSPEDFCEYFNEELDVMKEGVFSNLRFVDKRKCYAATLLFYVITPEYSYIFTQGDGYYGINEDSYMVKGNSYYVEDCTLVFERKIKTEDVERIWVSTDGLRYSEKIICALNSGRNAEDLEDLIRDEHSKKVLNDDFGLAWTGRK